jgi:cytidylate kinase
LTATAEERARRRHNELTEKGVNTSYTEVLNDIKARDNNDSKREFAPLRKADDAVLIDSTDKTIEEVIQEIEELVRVRGHNFAL